LIPNVTDIQHTALITGGTSGLGLETAVGLAKHGMRVLLIGRNEAAGAGALERIRQEAGADRATFLRTDLSVQAQIHDLAQRVRDLTNRLDVLIHGAGVVRARRHETAEGIEETLAVNFLAPRILTEELLPLLKSSIPARIISVTTIVEPLGSLHLHDLQRTEGYHALAAYAGTKRVFALWTRDLARQLEGSGVTVNLFDPYVMRTPFATAPDAPLLFKLAGPFLLNPQHAGKGLVRVATDPRLLKTTGARFLLGLRFPHLPGTSDEHLAQQLLQVSDPLIIHPSIA
jgi:NAD(P)-dependent dehydrogenase (short-subunit alcohol dehydrogenase family)